MLVHDAIWALGKLGARPLVPVIASVDLSGAERVKLTVCGSGLTSHPADRNTLQLDLSPAEAMALAEWLLDAAKDVARAAVDGLAEKSSG